MHTSNSKGFTLIEAAVAIAVVAILSGIITPLVVKSLRNAQVARARNDVQIIAQAVAIQLKDAGCRPTKWTVEGNPGGLSVWFSPGSPSVNVPFVSATNTFENLFTKPKTDYNAQKLFFGDPLATTLTTTARELKYMGPYMAMDAARKSDPWGCRYVICGYNASGQTDKLPIFVFSCGPDRTTWNANIQNAPEAWNTTGIGEDDIFVRVQ